MIQSIPKVNRFSLLLFKVIKNKKLSKFGYFWKEKHLKKCRKNLIPGHKLNINIATIYDLFLYIYTQFILDLSNQILVYFLEKLK